VTSFAANAVLRYSGTSGTFEDGFVKAGSGDLGGPTFLAFHDSSTTPVPEPATLALLGGAVVVGTAAISAAEIVRGERDNPVGTAPTAFSIGTQGFGGSFQMP